MTPYQEHILDAPDVCSNCLRKNRQDRVDPVRGGLGRELDSHYERDPRRTTVEFAPHEIPARSKGVFCRCGVEGPHDRVWHPDDVDREQFKDLLVASVATLEQKGVGIDRRETLAQALHAFDQGADVDHALYHAINYGLAVSVSKPKPKAEA